MNRQTDNMAVLIKTNRRCDEGGRGGRPRSLAPYLLKGTPNCLTLEVKSTLHAKSSHKHASCLPADGGHCGSVSGPEAGSRWLAGKWPLCLQRGCRTAEPALSLTRSSTWGACSRIKRPSHRRHPEDSTLSVSAAVITLYFIDTNSSKIIERNSWCATDAFFFYFYIVLLASILSLIYSSNYRGLVCLFVK